MTTLNAGTKAVFALAVGAATFTAYRSWIRPWAMHWGATDDEVKMHLPGDDLIASANFEATRAVSIDAPPEAVWPWLVQIGHGRAGWYSYDRLDNQGKPSAQEILPQFQHMEVGDVVVMTESGGREVGPSVLALEEPRMMLWGDPEEPHRFTWAWLLQDHDENQTRLVARVRCRLSLGTSIAGMPGWMFALMMELADPIMMRRQLLNLRSRIERAAA